MENKQFIVANLRSFIRFLDARAAVEIWEETSEGLDMVCNCFVYDLLSGDDFNFNMEAAVEGINVNGISNTIKILIKG